jgi:hypothetical protein
MVLKQILTEPVLASLLSFCNMYIYTDLVFCTDIKNSAFFYFATFMTINITSNAVFLGKTHITCCKTIIYML